jgi:hypothetical protein
MMVINEQFARKLAEYGYLDQALVEDAINGNGLIGDQYVITQPVLFTTTNPNATSQL